MDIHQKVRQRIKVAWRNVAHWRPQHICPACVVAMAAGLGCPPRNSEETRRPDRCSYYRPMSGQKSLRSGSSANTANSGYVIRPNFQKKFRAGLIKPKIRDVLMEYLGDKEYDAKTVDELTNTVADAIRNKLKELQLERYKFIVQVAIGEQRGEGVKMACRCLWDADADSYAHEIFMNNSLFCVATAFGIFYY